MSLRSPSIEFIAALTIGIFSAEAASVLLPVALASRANIPLRVHVNAALTTGANDGSSWDDAFRGPLGLANALASLGTDQTVDVWIAAGTYVPAAAGAPVTSHFALDRGSPSTADSQVTNGRSTSAIRWRSPRSSPATSRETTSRT